MFQKKEPLLEYLAGKKKLEELIEIAPVGVAFHCDALSGVIFTLNDVNYLITYDDINLTQREEGKGAHLNKITVKNEETATS